MNYKKIIDNSFSTLTPLTANEEIIRNVTERAEKMEKKKRISIKKPIIAVCAAVAAVAVGTTGAAAAGLINFNEIFGGTIKTQSNELGEKLIANVSDVKWTVSDDDYAVNLKGVTGTDDSLLAVIEIERADGQPVKDYLKNLDFLHESGFLTLFESVKLNGGFNREGAGGCNSRINDDGNIEITFDRSQEGMSGTTFELNSIGFYPTKEYHDTTLNVIDPMKCLGLHGYSSEFYLNEDEKACLEEIKLLDLSWSLEFTYTPTEEGEKDILADDFEEAVKLCVQVSKGDEAGVYESFDMAVEELKADSMGAVLKLSFVPAGYEPFWDYSFLPIMEKNEIKFINKDGTEISVTLGAWNSQAENDKCSIELMLGYSDGENIIAADVSEITAIEINGTAIKLK